MPSTSLTVCLLASAAAVTSAEMYPVVLLHGLFASAEAMSHAEGWINTTYPGTYVHNVEIGDGKLDSFVINMNKQAEMFAATVKADPKLANGFNLIAHSQGGMTARAYVERFNDPPVRRLITWASPHDGQFGIPDWPDALGGELLSKLFSEYLVDGSFSRDVQGIASFAAYWKNPLNYTTYLNDSIYLADMNNELPTKTPLTSSTLHHWTNWRWCTPPWTKS